MLRASRARIEVARGFGGFSATLMLRCVSKDKPELRIVKLAR
jgi:hypothetical protein